MKHFDQKLWIIPLILVLHAITACGQTYVNRHYYWNEDNNQWQYYIAPRHFASGSTTSWGLNTNNGHNGIGSPYIFESAVYVDAGAHLNIEAGVTVLVGASNFLQVQGNLLVDGTAADPVSFTGSSESPGWWRGLVVREGGSATLHWADVSYGGHWNVQDNIQRYFTVYKQGSGTLSLNNTVLRDSNGDGLMVCNNSGAVTLTGSGFHDHPQAGLRLLNSGLVTAQDCSFGDNNYGVFHEPDDAYSSLGNTYYNNASGHIGVNGGTITTDRSWYDDGVPIRITNNLTVGEGASLTVHPSAVIEFNKNLQMVVLGDLQVPGTEEQPVSFTGSSESPGWWKGLVVREGGSATLHWADVSYGGQFNTQDNIQRYFNLYKQGSGTLSLNNTVLRNSSGDGMMVCNNSGAVTLTSSSFNDNINSGLRLLNSGLVTAQDCYFGDNNYGVFHEPDDAYSSLGNTYYNNALGHIGVNGGTITTDRSWYDDGVPIRITNNLTVGEGASLTVHPSAVIEFNQSLQMVVLGDLQVPGTEEQPVSFTGSSESPGWWRGLVVRDGGSATLHWADVCYGGYWNVQDNIQYNFNLYKQGSGTLSLNNTVLRDSSGDGLILQSHTGQLFLTGNQFVSNHTGIKVRNQPESVVISGQSIMDNSAFGVINQTSAVVDARYNWWGHESGPYHATLNPSGQANAVSNGVLFNPWLEEAVFDFHVISATAAENGSIDPSGAVIVFTGNSQWFFMTPDEGYYIDDVQVDGLSVGAVDAFEFHNVTQDHSIHAQFAINTYVITAVPEHEAFGSVTGEGVYNHFDMVELTATPNTGYHFVNWTEEGDIVMDGDDPAGAVYTFMAEADRSLMAHFSTSMVTVTFAVENQHGDYIDDAIITIDGTEYSPGEYVFELFAGSYQYQVYKACYLTAADEFFAASDMTVTVVLETLPGDASGDGAVNVLDVIAIANYYTGVDVDPFCFSNADVNGDDAIDVLDVIATVNLFISGKTAPYTSLLSGAAHLYLNPEGVYLESDGTLAGLQFELTGSLLQALDLKLLLPDHQMVYAVDNDVLRVMIFSLDNTPIPAGTTGLVMLNAPEGLLQFGEALAGNLNAEKVELVTHNYDATSAGLNPEDAGLRFYPNPASGELFVTFTHAGDAPAVLSLVNLHGQAVLSETLTGRGRHETVLSLEGLTPGVYMLRLELGNHLFIEKVVIK
ncbi:MAG: T9SS type A sorting domain-containing protein [Bacteroidales bacterium]|nr:T9SS type A sorting domain-containing protein [Bacteroidales bacterium]